MHTQNDSRNESTQVRFIQMKNCLCRAVCIHDKYILISHRTAGILMFCCLCCRFFLFSLGGSNFDTSETSVNCLECYRLTVC